MINKLRTNPKVSYISRVLVLPLAAFLFLAFTLKTKKKSLNEDRITIVIDAGHGGTDYGVISADKKYKEADLTLQLAKQVQRFAGDYNIDVVMTRENESFPGNADNIKDALRKRTEMARDINPAAFISLHIGSAGQTGQENTTVSGFEAYVSSGANAEQSKVLASTVMDQIAALYTTRNPVKQRSSKIEVLDNNPVPAVIIECGFISNEKDLAFITDASNQEQVARKILQAVRQFHSITKTGPVNDLPPSLPTVDTPPALKKSQQINTDDMPFTKTEKMPEFEAGKPALQAYLMKNIDGSIPMKEGWKPGTYTETIVFVVERDGSISEISARNYSGSRTAHHCMDVISRAGKWKPATFRGKAVRAWYQQPITFFIEAPQNYTGSLHQDKNTIPGEVVILQHAIAAPASTKLDKEASFTGGPSAWKNHLIKYLNPSIPADEGWPQGSYTIVLSFVVKQDGSLLDITTENYTGTRVANHCIEMLKKSPAWIPAQLNGKPVNSYRKQPITFVVQEDGSKEPMAKDPVIFAVKDKMNRFFIGYTNNWVHLSTPYPENQLSKKIANGKINGKGNHFTVTVEKPGPVTIEILRKDPVSGTESIIGKQTFTSCALPAPGTPGYPEYIPYYINQNGTKEAYLSSPIVYFADEKEDDAYGIKEIQDFTSLKVRSNNPRLRIVQYNFSIETSDGQVIEVSVTGDQLTEKIKALLKKATNGTLVVFDSILAKDGESTIKVPAKLMRIL